MTFLSICFHCDFPVRFQWQACGLTVILTYLGCAQVSVFSDKGCWSYNLDFVCHDTYLYYHCMRFSLIDVEDFFISGDKRGFLP